MKNTKVLVVVFILIAILGGALVIKVRSDIAQRTPQMKAVEDFYRRYLGPSQNGDLKDPKKAAVGFFSKSLMAAWDENLKKCRDSGSTDICGWGADGDIFLQAQDIDPNLNYDNSKFRVFKFTNGFIEANFNVFPSKLKNGKLDPYYDRNIRFFMIEEDGRWVVDDIAYMESTGPASVRATMKQENEGK